MSNNYTGVFGAYDTVAVKSKTAGQALATGDVALAATAVAKLKGNVDKLSALLSAGVNLPDFQRIDKASADQIKREIAAMKTALAAM